VEKAPAASAARRQSIMGFESTIVTRSMFGIGDPSFLRGNGSGLSSWQR
jgi:hypothetical protein